MQRILNYQRTLLYIAQERCILAIMTGIGYKIELQA